MFWAHDRAIESVDGAVIAREDSPIVALLATKAGLVWATHDAIRTLDGDKTRLLRALSHVRALGTDGGDLFIASGDTISRGDGTTVSSVKLPVTAIASDATNVFWIKRDAHVCTGVLRAPKSGGEARRLDPMCATAIVTTDRVVYWARGDAVLFLSK